MVRSITISTPCKGGERPGRWQLQPLCALDRRTGQAPRSSCREAHGWHRAGRYLHHGLDRIVAQGLQQFADFPFFRFGVPAFPPPVLSPSAMYTLLL